MNVFFELADAVAKGDHKYIALYDTRKSAVIGGVYRGIMLSSERVWVEDESGVRFLKHRYSEARDTLVDIKEFLFIKLKSQPL